MEPSRLEGARLDEFGLKKIYELVLPIKQQYDNDCWIATLAMMQRWRTDNQSLSVKEVLSSMKPIYSVYYDTDAGLPGSHRAAFIEDNGLKAVAPQNFTVEGWADLLDKKGPLSVDVLAKVDAQQNMIWLHALLLIGVDTDTETFIWIDPGVGEERSGSFKAFLDKYEAVAATQINHLQIFHLK